MPAILRFFVLSIFIGFLSPGIHAEDMYISQNKNPEFIRIVKKPCNIGCDFQFQYCYYYNILNMDNAIKVKEWNVEDGFITGKAVTDIKARLLIKFCYQVSLTSAFPVHDKELNLEAEFEFKIKLGGEGMNQCIEFQKDLITFSSFELKGDLKTDPIPLLQGQLSQEMSDIIRDSVSRAVYDSLPANNRDKMVYCSKEHNDTYADNAPCPCD